MIEPVVLQGQQIRLEPLQRQHQSGLEQVVQDGDLWQLFFTFVPPPQGISEFIENAMQLPAKGEGLAFAIIDQRTEQLVGSTRFMRADLAHRKAELGFSFLGQSWQKTYVNTEAKLLMLQHAFETLDWVRVELLTDVLNHASRQAIARLGAREEGLLRSHMIMRDGRVRDSVIFSIVQQDWPGVKLHLQHKLSRIDSKSFKS